MASNIVLNSTEIKPPYFRIFYWYTKVLSPKLLRSNSGHFKIIVGIRLWFRLFKMEYSGTLQGLTC